MKLITNAENVDVLYEDNHVIGINKLVGAIVQGDKTGDVPLSEHLKAYLKKKYNKPGEAYLGVVHRLDRPTTGVVLFAKTSKALSRLNAMFADKAQVQKTYWALVDAMPPATEGTLTHWLVRNEKQNKSVAHNKEVQQSKKAVLHYKLLKSFDHYHLLEIDLITGRHHQIRAQLAAIGLHIKGDLKYGAKRSNPDGGICLHAYKLTFEHPVKKEVITIEAAPNWQLGK